MTLRQYKSILQVGIVVLIILNGVSASKELKGFSFLKEHDGSITGVEDGIQQIKLAGIFSYLSCQL